MKSYLQRADSNKQTGMTLIELMIAMAVLAFGMTALLALFMTGTESNNRNSKDSSATLLSQKVLEEIMGQDPNSTAAVVITDCAGNAWNIATAGGAAPTGSGANLVNNAANPAYGLIDQTQALAAVPANYSMQYVDCDANGRQTIYDVRWNVMTVSANTTRLVTVSARQLVAAARNLGGIRFAVPVTLRSIGGP